MVAADLVIALCPLGYSGKGGVCKKGPNRDQYFHR